MIIISVSLKIREEKLNQNKKASRLSLISKEKSFKEFSKILFISN